VVREIERNVAAIDQFPVFEPDGHTKKSGLLAGNFTSTVFQEGVVVAVVVTITEIGATGEYKTSFTPTGQGLYELQVKNDYNDEIWHGQYVSVDELTNVLAETARDQVLKIDQAAVDTPPTDDSLFDQLANKDAGKTFDPASDSLEAIADSLASFTGSTSTTLTLMQTDLARVLGLLHRNAILDNQTYDAQGQLTSARLRVFDSSLNVPSTPGGAETVGKLHEYEIEAEYDGLNLVRRFALKQVL
jgi:hypothetical protein